MRHSVFYKRNGLAEQEHSAFVFGNPVSVRIKVFRYFSDKTFAFRRLVFGEQIPGFFFQLVGQGSDASSEIYSDADDCRIFCRDGFAEYSADFFAVQINVVDPFDLRFQPADLLDGVCDSYGGS